MMVTNTCVMYDCHPFRWLCRNPSFKVNTTEHAALRLKKFLPIPSLVIKSYFRCLQSFLISIFFIFHHTAFFKRNCTTSTLYKTQYYAIFCLIISQPIKHNATCYYEGPYSLVRENTVFFGLLRMLWQKYLRMGDLQTTEIPSPQLWGPGRSKSNLGSGEAPFPGTQMVLLAVCSPGRRCLWYTHTDCSWGLCHHDPITSDPDPDKCTPLHTITLGLCFQHGNHLGIYSNLRAVINLR